MFGLCLYHLDGNHPKIMRCIGGRYRQAFEQTDHYSLGCGQRLLEAGGELWRLVFRDSTCDVRQRDLCEACFDFATGFLILSQGM
ncbi:hypothetical protein VTK56DRAFT_8332 [Thermocarpiscus australiensis]